MDLDELEEFLGRVSPKLGAELKALRERAQDPIAGRVARILLAAGKESIPGVVEQFNRGAEETGLGLRLTLGKPRPRPPVRAN